MDDQACDKCAVIYARHSLRLGSRRKNSLNPTKNSRICPEFKWQAYSPALKDAVYAILDGKGPIGSSATTLIFSRTEVSDQQFDGTPNHTLIESLFATLYHDKCFLCLAPSGSLSGAAERIEECVRPPLDVSSEQTQAFAIDSITRRQKHNSRRLSKVSLTRCVAPGPLPSSSSLPKTCTAPGNSDALIVAAPTATIPFFKNDRRFSA